MNFEEKQKKLLENAEKTLGSAIEVNIIFNNDEIPLFLKKLKEFENESRETKIRCK